MGLAKRSNWLDECAATYFEQGFVSCTSCGGEVDVWKAALESVNAVPGLAWGPTAAGAAVTNCMFELEAGKFTSIDLTTHGIPAEATVLAITYGPQGGGVFPIEWHGNTPQRRITGTALGLIGYPTEGAGPSGRVVASVVWVAKQDRSHGSTLSMPLKPLRINGIRRRRFLRNRH